MPTADKPHAPGYQAGKMRPETQMKINRVAAEVISGKKKKDALISAGYSEKNRKVMTAVKRTLAAHLDKIGLTDEELARRIKAATEAEETVSATFQGKFTDEKKIPDNKARNRALELAAEVKGHRPGREINTNYSQPVNIQVNFGGITTGTPPARDAGFSIDVTPPDLPPKSLPEK